MPDFPITRLPRRIGMKCKVFYRAAHEAAERLNGRDNPVTTAPVLNGSCVRIAAGRIPKGAALRRVFGNFCRVTKVTPAERRLLSFT